MRSRLSRRDLLLRNNQIHSHVAGLSLVLDISAKFLLHFCFSPNPQLEEQTTLRRLKNSDILSPPTNNFSFSRSHSHHFYSTKMSAQISFALTNNYNLLYVDVPKEEMNIVELCKVSSHHLLLHCRVDSNGEKGNLANGCSFSPASSYRL